MEQASNVTAITPPIEDKKYDEYRADIELLRSAISNREEGTVWLPNTKTPEQAADLLYTVSLTYNVNGLSPTLNIVKNPVDDGYGIELEYSLDAETMKREREEVERFVDSLLQIYNTIEDASCLAAQIALDVIVYAKNLFADFPNPTLSQVQRAQTLEGVFIDHRACCLGIARAYEMLCRRAGLECFIVYGNHQLPEANTARARAEISNTITPISPRYGNHVWNYLVVDGVGMYVDLTFTMTQPRRGADGDIFLPFALSKQMLLDWGYQEVPGRPFPDAAMPENPRLHWICLAPPREFISGSDDRSS